MDPQGLPGQVREYILGNLHCALVGLLDGDGPLSQVMRLLDRINRILG